MNNTLFVNVIGFIAAGIGTVMFLPQVIQAAKTKQTKDISFLSYSLLATSSFFWTIYGIMTFAMPIILVNVIIFILSLYLLFLKRKYG